MKKVDSSIRYQRLLERFGNGDLSRRQFLGLLGCAGVVAGVHNPTLFGWVREARAAVSQLRFDGWGGTVSEALRKGAFDPYTDATGITVVDGTFGSEEEHLTNVRAAQPGEYNIHLSSGLTKYKQFIDAGLGVKLNEDNIPNLKLVMTAMIEPFRKVSPDGLSAVPFDYGTTGIAYNTKHISEDEAKEQGANLLLREDLKGKISGYNDWQTRAWYGALQSGQDPNNITDIDAAWDKARANRDLVLKYGQAGQFAAGIERR